MAAPIERKYFWHVSYFIKESDAHDGFGHTVFSTKSDVMPLVEAMNFIKHTTNSKKVVILNWREIRKEIFDQFCEMPGDIYEPVGGDDPQNN